MKKYKILITSLVLVNVITAILAFAIYAVAENEKARLDEESHHLFLRSENYKAFILNKNIGISPQELLIKYNSSRELTEYEIKTEVVELNLLYFQFKEGKLIGIE